MKHVTLTKDHQGREEGKAWILPLVNSYSKINKSKIILFDVDQLKYPKFKSEFKKYICPSCKTEEAVFVLKTYLLEKVREVKNTEELDELWNHIDKRYKVKH